MITIINDTNLLFLNRFQIQYPEIKLINLSNQTIHNIYPKEFIYFSKTKWLTIKKK